MNRQEIIAAVKAGESLAGADLTGADLTRADLTGTDLTGANLTEADLSWADLTRANLSWADLSWADLTRADLTRADLSGAKNLIAGGTDQRGFQFVGWLKDDQLMISAGCRCLTSEEALGHWRRAHNDNWALKADCLSRVNMIIEIATAYGWVK